MSPSAFSEDQLVEQPAIQLFAELGWETLSASEEVMGDSGTLGREFKSEVVLERLNSTRGKSSVFRKSKGTEVVLDAQRRPGSPNPFAISVWGIA